MEAREAADLVIVGAGINGLAAARTYCTIHPSANVVILESAASIGGVWAKERLYSGLRLNNLLGTYEYSDFPMDEAFGIQPGQHITGEATHRYLMAYAEEFELYSRVRLQSRVETVEKLDRKSNAAWLMTYTKYNDDGESQRQQIFTRKLIVATGVASEPFIPTLKGAETFDAPLLHSKDTARKQREITEAKRVVVLGGAKSGYDAAYLAASHGVEVDWIISKSGRGASWMAPPYVTPLKKWLEKLVNTRFLTWFSPCSWGEADGFGGIRGFLHGTFIGRWIVDVFWKILANDVVTLNGYRDHPETKKLEPWTDAFWSATTFSILNYPTHFYDLVRDGKIRVHVADISHLSPKTVHFVGGQAIKADAFISCTGWTALPTIKFLPEGIEEQMGLPHKTQNVKKLARKADAEILSRFPRLKRQPEVKNPYGGARRDCTRPEDHEPYRLYRHMVPPDFIHDRSLGFLGTVSNFSTVLTAQTQALWLVAYMDGKLALDTCSPTFEDDLHWDTVLHSQFGKWRYPFTGQQRPDFVFDAVPYLDWLLRDLGLKVHRKGGLLAEIFEPYGPADYRSLIEEWQRSVTQE
ncbi:hypothetical protein D8B26_004086 [Coccidioides posadasii str. Silveira]|uniref:Uncharacterized protein n=2 Tax=Coccidioides posadasii TaxID=199306 RepID=E9DHT0_COCPS|nr:Flavin-binding monooxygenase-like family protein [Coccidioides posadasii C735 delta SOWgp]EER25801.1 Flavin-binding monooxygenase-like family protein [Coccidioides posadasii C735 delta SOWgp]EFW14012.1 conserved hypothetical protein [Coccidioides posadasii str. Silveira]QVM09424.1 hypothetical protein D8B26_004086 [Coccidioides posadasii str. Silveira]|eukprot:XP_003067946.1 Flavin-binding monooxygenase-like family protein [Coccidioides posadasii C735 delta SOWgp]